MRNIDCLDKCLCNKQKHQLHSQGISWSDKKIIFVVNLGMVFLNSFRTALVRILSLTSSLNSISLLIKLHYKSYNQTITGSTVSKAFAVSLLNMNILQGKCQEILKKTKVEIADKNVSKVLFFFCDIL